jgi:hypothetical protein
VKDGAPASSQSSNSSQSSQSSQSSKRKAVPESLTEQLKKRLKGLHASAAPAPAAADPVREEVERYLAMAIVQPVVAPGESWGLAWWELHAAEFPLLSQLARKFLAIPATAAPSERCWSGAGNIVADNRASMSPGVVEMAVFCRQNIDICRELVAGLARSDSDPKKDTKESGKVHCRHALPQCSNSRLISSVCRHRPVEPRRSQRYSAPFRRIGVQADRLLVPPF